jgi:hypothetical protein
VERIAECDLASAVGVGVIVLLVSCGIASLAIIS